MLAAAALAVLAVLTGCQVTTAVGVDVARDGSGVVRLAVGLDEQAAARVPDLAGQLRVDDLRRSGWEITGPRKEDDGRTWVRAAKPFAEPEDLEAVVAEISGAGGPFREFRLDRSRSLFRATTSFSGTVDLTGGLEAFGDDDLRARLGGSSFGLDAAELERRVGSALDRAFTFRVAVRLPGDVSANAPDARANGAEWRPTLGQRAVLEAEGEAWIGARVLGAAIAALAVVALASMAAARLARRGQRRPVSRR